MWKNHQNFRDKDFELGNMRFSGLDGHKFIENKFAGTPA